MLASPSKPILAWPTPSPVSVPDIIWGRNYHLGIFRIIFNCNLSSYLRCSLIKDLRSSPLPLSLRRCILLAPPANMPIISFHFFDTKYPLFCQLFFLWPCSHYWCHCSHWISNQQKNLRIIFPISGVVSLLSMTMTHNTVDQWRWRSGDIHHRDINICSAAIIAVQWLHFEKTEDFEQLWSVSDWTFVVSWEVEGKKIALRAFLDKRSCGWHGSISKIWKKFL